MTGLYVDNTGRLQFVHDGQLDQLVEAQRLRRRLVVLGVIRLVDGIAAKQYIQLGWLAHFVLACNGLVTAAHESALEARAGNAIESHVECEQPVLQ